jgi:hypothetical protein
MKLPSCYKTFVLFVPFVVNFLSCTELQKIKV